MDKDAVAAVAQQLFDAEAGTVFRGLEVMHVRANDRGEWIVLFSSRFPDGSVADSPPAVIVDDATAQARLEYF